MSFAAAAALSSIGDIGSAMLSQYYNKKNMRDQAKLQYQYAQQYALNSPTWNIQGLRDAGLNPMLAVSNGVNLGANIPNITNSSPKADIKVPALEALRASKEIDIGEQNAASQSTSAEAEMIRAKSDAALKQAQTAEVIQRTGFERDRLGQHKYNSPMTRDIMGMVDDLKNMSKDFFKEASAYFLTEPTRADGKPVYPRPTADSTQTKQAEFRAKEADRQDQRFWKTRKTFDGKPVYRKPGDVGGNMILYR